MGDVVDGELGKIAVGEHGGAFPELAQGAPETSTGLGVGVGLRLREQSPADDGVVF